MAHRLLVLGCRTMRDGVVVSFVFLAAAVLLFLAATHVVPAVAFARHLVLLLALVLIVLPPVVLVSTFLIAVRPGAREKLENCEHALVELLTRTLIAAAGQLSPGARLLFTSAEAPGHCTGSVGPYREVIDHLSLGRVAYTELLTGQGMRLLSAELSDGGHFTYLSQQVPAGSHP